MYTWLPVAVSFLASLCFRLCEDPKQCSSIQIWVLLWFDKLVLLLFVWEQDWLMSFHLDKCNIMKITTKRNSIHFYYNMHGHILESVQRFRLCEDPKQCSSIQIWVLLWFDKLVLLLFVIVLLDFF
jgi:phage terminase large subunit